MPEQFRSINQLILETTSKYSNLPALSLKTGFRTKTYTYKDIYDNLRRFPEYFESIGLKKGDKIIVLSLNRPEYSMLILAALCCEITIVPIDFRTNKETIGKFVKATEPKAIFTSIFFKNLFEGFHPKVHLFEEVLGELSKFEMGVLPQSDPNSLAALLFTSGTTGEPKGTKIIRDNILASVNGIREIFSLPPEFRVLSILPLSHALEMFGGFMMTYTYGCHIHYIERINSITITQALRRYKIEGMAVVPQMLRIILQNVERKIEEDKMQGKWESGQKLAPYLPFGLRREVFYKLHQSLGGEFKLFVSGSAPLERKLAQTWENTGIHVLEGYGASETTGFVSANSLKANKVGTVGKMLPGLDFQRSEEGELLVAGRNIVSGYYNNPEKTEESFQNGWFHTGDIVQVDRDGFVKIVGRDKFKIVLADGKKVYPEDIETKLNNNSGVIDSTVFGVPTDEGEIVHAELILKNPHKGNEIVSEVNKLLNAHEQILDFGVWEEKDFPRNKTLKVDRQAVKDLVMAKKSGNHKAEEKAHTSDDKLSQILRIITGNDRLEVSDKDVLSTDFKLDSLKRIELLALVEEEMGVSLEELKITPQSTVGDVRELIKNGKPVTIEDGEKLSEYQFTNWMSDLRIGLQNNLMFPLFNIAFKIKVVHPENLIYLKTPQLFIFNHVGVYDVINILRILPDETRRKLAIAAHSLFWHQAPYIKWFMELFPNAFPFVKAESHGAMRGNFDRVGTLLDKGFNIMISPEGNISPNGELLPFHTGAGYIAVEMGVPVVPFKINGYFELWPEDDNRKLDIWWPKKFGTVEVVVGEPITFKSGTSYEEATEILRQSIINLK